MTAKRGESSWSPASLEKTAASLVILATIAGAIWGSSALALGIAVGGFLFVANVYALRVVMRALIASGYAPRQMLLGAVLVLKFLLIGGLIYVLISRLTLNPIGVLIGLSVVVVSIIGEGFRLALKVTRTERAQERQIDG